MHRARRNEEIALTVAHLGNTLPRAPRSRRAVRSAFGFTLVEMLVAMAIFGVIAAVAYRVLDTSLQTRERVGAEYQRWRDIARAMGSIQRDVEAVQHRPIRDSFNLVSPPLVGVPVVTRTDEATITVTRGGDAFGAGRAAAPRRVGYRVREGALELLTWTALDQAPRARPEVITLATDVAALSVRYRDIAGRWENAWPPVRPGVPVQVTTRSATVPLPTGVEISLVLGTGERITKLVPILARSES